ncbi:hypothetical protein SAMN05428959_1011015 [Duganella sp. CF517]|nr:hypothetical protein SAMN05428959_1011015 [Duganella sp. CF517]
MGAPGAQMDSAKRILAHLEHGARLPASKPARAAWAVDGWTLGLGMLLLAMCGIAWLMHDKSATSNGFKTSYSSTRALPRHEAIPARARLENAHVDPGEVIVDPVELPAAIVNDPAQLLAENKLAGRSESRSMTTPTTAPREVGPTAYTQSAAAAARPTPGPQPLLAETTRVASVGAAYPKPAGAISKYNSASAATPRVSQATATATASRGKAAAPTNDTDVALLTALVAHAGKPAVVAPERSRDIVERRDGDNTADLLARCKQLGLIEGMLCRSRICSGRWDSDATCRAPAN